MQRNALCHIILPLTRALTCLLLTTLALVAQAAETYSALITDAETGEALPFVQIYISEGRGTISNSEGQFCIEAEPWEQLFITCIGYQRVRIKAADLPHTLRLLPAETELREVTVVASGNILKQVAQQMELDYRKHKNAYTYYYMRQTYRMEEAAEMAEAYFTANSANNLRQVKFLAGRVFHGQKGEQKLALDFSNIHSTLSLAPMIKGEVFWREVSIPLNRKSTDSRYTFEDGYQTSITSQTDQEGKRILCIHMQRTQTKKTHKAAMSGNLYVEADSLRPICFQGKIEGLRLETTLNGEQKTKKATIDINISYSHEQGFNKVTSISTRLKSKGIDCQTTTYNVDNLSITDESFNNRSDNLITAIRHTSKDAAWWKKNIIQPTEAEKKIIEAGERK